MSLEQHTLKQKSFKDRLELLFDIKADKRLVFEKKLLLDYIQANQAEFVAEIKNGKGIDLRKKLGLSGVKYEKIWLEIVEMLRQNLSSELVKDSMLEQGLIVFNALMTSARIQREFR
ncbi:MAG: hypothetical protein WC843_01680 [Candidatus Gracilibacteria bacterium]|jgi:hypothetical protein